MEVAMGYYTDYGLIMIGPEDEQDKIREELRSLGMIELADEDSMSAKWYNHEEDMSRIAKKYPNVLIRLSGCGEEQDDIWEKRWKGKHFEHHWMEMPSFTNPELLINNK